jgi:hypothetical protein
MLERLDTAGDQRQVDSPAVRKSLGVITVVVEEAAISCAFVANAGTTALTKAVVAMEVSLSDEAGVGAVGLPVKTGDANNAKPDEEVTQDSVAMFCVLPSK